MGLPFVWIELEGWGAVHLSKVRAQSGALRSSGANHCTRLRFRELALALLSASPTYFGEVCFDVGFHAMNVAWSSQSAAAIIPLPKVRLRLHFIPSAAHTASSLRL